MKIDRYNDFINENISMAKAILRKVNKDTTDKIYNRIIDTTNKDGYTGLITKYVFIDNQDIDEVLDLYKTLKEKSIDNDLLVF